MLKREKWLYLILPLNLHHSAMQFNSLITELKVSAGTITNIYPNFQQKKIH